MKKKITLRVITAMLSAAILFSCSVPVSAGVGNEGSKVIKGTNEYFEGFKPMTEEEEKWLEDNSMKIKDVTLNKIGLDRVNKTRKSKGLSQVNSTAPAETGSDVVLSSKTQVKASADLAAPAAVVNAVTGSALPARVDNTTDSSTAMYFPNIGHQNGNSCATFSLTYYIMTYMTAMQRGVAVKNGGVNDETKVFSPKWTFNIDNRGIDNGPTSLVTPYRILFENGCATWSQFPDNANYKEWCSDPEVWKSAINNRIDHIGQIKDFRTDKGFELIKKLLNNGYMLQFSTMKNMYDNSCYYRKDNSSLNESCYYQNSATSGGGHAMTIVGYDDEIWFDTNSDNIKDISSEVGAIKVANSWGKDWRNGKDGFFWVSYNAIKNLDFIYESSGVLWMDVRYSYKPKLLAKFTLSTKNRNSLAVSLGYSDTGRTTPVDNMKSQTFIPSLNEPISFDGTLNECQRTFYLDYTDLIYKNNLSDSNTYRWYINVSGSQDYPVTLKEFSIVDPNGNPLSTVFSGAMTSTGETIKLYGDCAVNTVVPSPLPSVIPGTPVNFKAKSNYNEVSLTWEPAPSPNVQPIYYRLEVDGDRTNVMNIFDTKASFKFPSKSPHKFRIAAVNSHGVSNWSNLLQISTLDSGMSLLNNMGTSRNGLGAVQLNGKIYAAGGYNSSNGYLKSLEEYNPVNGMWTTKENMSEGKRDICMVSANNKIYVIGGYNGSTYLNTLEIYDPNSTNINKWSVSSKVMPNRRGAAAAVVIGSKIYVIGGVNSSGVLNSMDVYDIQNDIWSTTYHALKTPRFGLGAAAAGGKIYSFGGTTTDSAGTRNLNTIEVFDTTQKISTVQTVYLKTAKTGLAAAAVNNKIYIAGGAGSTDIEEYDTAGCNIISKSSLSSARTGLSAAVIGEKIYFVGGASGSTSLNECLQFEPLFGCTVYKATNPSGREAVNAVELNGKIYTIGSNGNISNPFDVYDPANNTWSTPTIPPMIGKRDSFGLASVNGYIYAINGVGESQVLNSIERYEPLQNKWVPAGQLNKAHKNPVCVVLNGKIYVIGSTNIASNVIEEYDPITLQVKEFSNGIISGAPTSAATIGNKIYISSNGQIYEFRPDTGAIIDLNFPVYDRYDIKVSAIGELLYIFGGLDSTDKNIAKNVSQIMVYSPVENSFKTDPGSCFNGFSRYASLSYKGSIIFFGERYSYTHYSQPDVVYNPVRHFPANTLEFKPNSYFPANLGAAISGNSVVLTWDAVPKASSYFVDINGLQIEELSTSYIHRNIQSPSKMHTYRVKAVTNEGSSVWGRRVTGKYIITGDVNIDGAITIDDYNLVNQHLSNTTTLSNEQLTAADVDNSGTVTTNDRTIISNYINGIISAFPIGNMRFAVFGDIDGNGLINMDDNDLISKFLAGTATFTSYQKMRADVDLNGIVDTNDSTLHRQYLLDTIPKLPIK